MKYRFPSFVVSLVLFFNGHFVSAEEVKYEFSFTVSNARYFGSDSEIMQLLANANDTITGVVTYDTSASGVVDANNPNILRYPQSGFSAGISVPQLNGVTWEADSSAMVVTVIDRDNLNDAVVFEGSGADGAVINIPGLAVDFIKLSLFYPSTEFGDIDFQADYPLPPPGNNVDLRAIDSNNSEFRVFGTLQTLQRVPVENPLVCGTIAVPVEPEFFDNQVYNCATDFGAESRFDADTPEDLQTYITGGYGDVGDGRLKNLRVRFNPDDDTVITSPCSVRFVGEKNSSPNLNRFTLLAGGSALVRPRSGSMTVAESLTIVSRDSEAALVSSELISVGTLCLQAPNVRINSIGQTTVASAELFSISNEVDGTTDDSTLEINGVDMENSVLRLKTKAELE